MRIWIFKKFILIKGQIIDEQKMSGTLLYNLKAYMPVNESTGFTSDLRQATSGKAFEQCSFDHWQTLPGDPFVSDSKCGEIVRKIRKLKNLREELPTLADYLDKL